MLLGSGGASPGVGMIVRPVLYGEEIQCICSATPAEYNKGVDNDPLLTPHFELVEIPPVLPRESKY